VGKVYDTILPGLHEMPFIYTVAFVWGIGEGGVLNGDKIASHASTAAFNEPTSFKGFVGVPGPLSIPLVALTFESTTMRMLGRDGWAIRLGELEGKAQFLPTVPRNPRESGPAHVTGCGARGETE
jgi:hypothetical protein